MAVFTLVIVVAGLCLSTGLARAFGANPWLNALILALLTFGIVAAFRQVSQVRRAIEWVAAFRTGGAPSSQLPSILIPLSPALSKAGEKPSASPTTMRAMLEGVFARVDESRELSRYLMNVLILLGLLGTFWGLLETVAGIGTVMSGLSVGDGDLKVVFDRFKEGLQTPLLGMGVSFSASLFGLASSLILGFLDLTAGRVQTRFCEELEDWFTHSPVAEIADMAKPASDIAPARYQEALVQNLADQLERLHKTFKMQEEARSGERASMLSLAERFSAFDDHLKSQQVLLVKLAELQQQVAPVLGKLSDKLGNSNQETIEEHTRRIDLNLKDIGEKVSRSADTLASELREELKIIAKILASNEASTNA
jgi:biopolymer transport protein ExbB/TolQ